ncbi:hypothetical protein CDD82_5073 [Ophiocordyceps australis]|uniref:Amine oxidase domain-containing protein n=1 Tax=Ophiocordyceps australis TaxID=1399860 RepID=A0A2C5YX99_9HYPO|nr:hypothetical protein CDD82_5073 [Ophiocordyceps australis]
MALHDQPSQIKVAIIGTGLAGLTTAHLLHNDAARRFHVTLFEQAETLAFDGASVAVRDDETGLVERLDLPMRACAGGYYANLLRMYNYLGIPLHPVRFLFVFARALSCCSELSEALTPQQAGSVTGSYFIHASNLHQTPPPRPTTRHPLAYVAETLFLIICYCWFTAACFFVPPLAISHNTQTGGETVAQYLDRIWLPQRYVSHYLLPLMSSVATCSHNDFLAFPASDLINYKKLSHGQQHYTVCGGVQQVQSKLAKGLRDIRLASRVLSLQATNGCVLVRYMSRRASHSQPILEECLFDRVVLAVSPDVAASLFRPLAAVLGQFPTKRVESSVLSPKSHVFTVVQANEKAATHCMHHNSNVSPAQVITLRTSLSKHESTTEALHALPSGLLVQTCPLSPNQDSACLLQTAKFTRTLRTPQSKAATLSIVQGAASGDEGAWTNGQDNVWLAGSWCWDGMVLLEGCVISAMRVARDCGVEIPW